MKTAFGLMILGFVVGTQAALASQFEMPGLLAREGYSMYRSNLTDIRLDPTLKGGLEIRGGTLEIDTVAREATLRIWRAPHCPQGALCAQYLPSPIIAKLPIVKKTTNDCGIRFMVARVASDAADGAAKRIIVIDNTKNTCPTFNTLPATEVHYETIDRNADGSTLHTHSTMYGEPLRKLDAQY